MLSFQITVPTYTMLSFQITITEIWWKLNLLTYLMYILILYLHINMCIFIFQPSYVRSVSRTRMRRRGRTRSWRRPCPRCRLRCYRWPARRCPWCQQHHQRYDYWSVLVVYAIKKKYKFITKINCQLERIKFSVCPNQW